MAIKKIMLTIDEEIVKEVDQKAKDEGRSRNNYITQIIKDYESKTTEYKNKIAMLEKELIEKNVLIKTIPTTQNIQTEVKSSKYDDDDMLESIQFPIGGL